ncbi:MAG: zf-HC2 domain-containing protein [Longimicrobiales bacterium]
MNDHPREDRVQDYVDDLLCPEERAEVEQHLAACAQCLSEVAALRDLVADLHNLPAEIQPDSDLLSVIHARIDAHATHATDATHATHTTDTTDTTTAARLRDRSLYSLRYPLAAAAVVLIAVSTALTVMLVQRNGGSVRLGNNGSRNGSTVLASRQTSAVDQRYSEATAELENLLQSQRSQLAPETIRLVEENLRVIDQALAEARAALREDPSDPALSDFVRSAYEKKIDLLRHATRGAT